MRGPVMMVRVGEHSKLDREWSEKDYPVRSITPHPLYNDSSQDNDIAILKLFEQVALNSHVQLICLPESAADPHDYQTTTAVGWGDFRKQGNGSVSVVPGHNSLRKLCVCAAVVKRT